VPRFARGSRGDGQCHASGKAVAQHRSVHEFPPGENSTLRPFERNCWIEIDPAPAAGPLQRRLFGITRRLEAIRVVGRVGLSARTLMLDGNHDDNIRPRVLSFPAPRDSECGIAIPNRTPPSTPFRHGVLSDRQQTPHGRRRDIREKSGASARVRWHEARPRAGAGSENCVNRALAPFARALLRAAPCL